MLDELLNLIKQNSQQAIVENPAVPNEQNNAVMQETGNSIISSLQSMLSGGKAADVLSLFGGQGGNVSDHPVTQNISDNLISNLMSKFGLNNQQAGGIASSILPMVLSKLVHKTNDSNDNSLNIQGIFNSLSGGNTSGLDIQGILSKFTGGNATAGAGSNPLDKNNDGKVDLSDITAAFSGNSGQGGGGGILDSLKGLFGK
ncbi:MAG: DUF937 domain-containing protein [Bacteroidetes bacterium]|nr:DUF937 domain-containing protein [Bacteroidota bacterium]MBS1755885.1 DUF937 domain-containing protein [Bacteroidota bacterium]